MNLNDDPLLEIAARAMTLEEKLRAPAPRLDRAVAESLDAAEPWRRLVAGGDRATFRRRLSWDGLREADVLSALSSRTPVRPASAPHWMASIQGGIERCAEVRESLAMGRPLPELARFPEGLEPRFGEVWVPFVRHARAALARKAGKTLAVLGTGACAALEDALLSQVARLGELTLYESFDAWRKTRLRSIAAPRRGVSGIPARDLYFTFVASLLSGQFVPLFTEYSALARQLGIRIDTWIDSSAELAARLESDGERLREHFGAAGRVVKIRGGLSDRHARGRTVLALSFASGARIIYKPRTVGLEAAWNDFLGWLGRCGAQPALPASRLLECDGYGYAELLEPGELGSPEHVAAYFRAAGGLLCASWFLGANDLHMENVIATARGPVIVDAESLLQPQTRDGNREERSASASSRAIERLSRSFLGTGLLTLPQLDAEGTPVDLGGLRGTGGQSATAAARRFRFPNTDAMEIVREPALAPARQNLPRLLGHPVFPEEAPEALIDGFTSVYRFLLEHRADLLEPEGPLKVFAGRVTRFLFRSSGLYAQVLDELSAPLYLRAGTTRSFALDAINRASVAERSRPVSWPLTRQERAALEDFDIPYFAAAVDSAALLTRGAGRASRLIALSGLEAARRRLRRMDESDLKRQLAILADALRHGPAPRTRAAGTRPSAPSPVNLIALAEDIAAEVLSGDTEDVTRTEGLSLYDGATGPALFFAALYAATGRDLYREKALTIGPRIQAVLSRPDPMAILAAGGIGAADGFGSLLYGLVTIGRLVSDPSLAALCGRTAGLLTREAIHADRRFDVQSGSAGAILGLLALHRSSGEKPALERAVACGENLLLHKRDFGGGRWGWPSSNGLCLAGLAHGASGIALALVRLSAATGRTDFRDAAHCAARYERSLFDARRKNWPVLAGKDGAAEKSLFMTAWCHGAPGVALARLAWLQCEDSDTVRADLAQALDATRRVGILGSDHLCCGNAGVLETLLTAGEILGEKEWVASAQARAAVVVHAAASRGRFRFGKRESEAERSRTSFFRGLPGLGYTLLRLAGPGRLPAVLAFGDTPHPESRPQNDDTNLEHVQRHNA